MNENKLLASVALFSKLYDKDKDIYDVIGEFIKAAILLENKWTFNVTEASKLVNTAFGFQIPEAVVKTSLKRLKKQEGFLSLSDGIYSIESGKMTGNDLLSSSLEATKNKQKEIIEDLISYIESKSSSRVDKQERAEIVDKFCGYLLGEDTPKKYWNFISSYIIERKSREGFTESLNAVREGFVLYNGIRYSPNLNDLRAWETPLTVYLDTEHLFNAVGYNGDFYKQLFDDFDQLVKEINQGSRRLIILKYFEQCKSEIDRFFYMAESIIERKAEPGPPKTAMSKILDGCEAKSEIVSKQTKFYHQLERRGIKQETGQDYYKEPIFNMEGEKIVTSLKTQEENRGRKFDTDKCCDALRLFTKINVLRQGKNTGIFEDIGYILVSGKNFTNFLAYDPLVKANKKDCPFSVNLEFATNRIWFKLQKGLTSQTALPKSLDIVAKAQVVLSSQISNSVSEKYYSLQEQLSNEEITREEAEYMNHELRSRTTTPESIIPEKIDSILEFVSQQDIESHLREKSFLEERATKGEDAIRELNSIKLKEKERKKEEEKKRARVKAETWRVAKWVGLIFCILASCALASALAYKLVLYLLSTLTGEADVNEVIPIMISIILFIIPGVLSLTQFGKIKTRINNSYKKTMEDHMKTLDED